MTSLQLQYPRVAGALRALAILGVLAGVCAPLRAQSISGVVLDDGTGSPLPGALIVLLDQRRGVAGEAVAGDTGVFRFDLPGPGSYILVGSLIGYAGFESAPLTLGAIEDVVVEVRMAVEAVPLEPLIVRSRANAPDSQLGGFYSRMARGNRSGLGYFISREEVDRRAAFESSDLLRMAPGVRVVPGRNGAGAAIRMTGGCIPAIYVDGIQVNRYPLGRTSLDDIVPPIAIEGIEVYRGSMAQVAGYHDPGGCGMVLVWTRRGDDSGEPWSWKKFLAGASLFAIVFFLIH